MSAPSTRQRFVSEAIGTFLATAIPTVIDILYFTNAGPIDDVERWLARGLGVTAIIYALAEISGAHVDPAVSIAFALRGVMSARLAALYVIAQFTGAFAAAAMALWIFGRAALALGASHPGPHIAPAVAFGAEVVCSFALMLVILMTAQEEAVVGKQAAIAVGMMVATCGFVAGPLSGASMNPARTLAPAVLAGALGTAWIYATAPIIGAALAVPAQFALCGRPSHGQKRAAKGTGGG